MGYFCSLDVIYEANHVRVSSMDVVLGAIQYNTKKSCCYYDGGVMMNFLLVNNN